MERLVREVQKSRDPEAFIQLMERNRMSMLKTAKAYLRCEEDVADAMQETILTCWEKLDTLREPKYFKTWLIRITINNCLDILRQNRDTELPGELPVQESRDSAQTDLEFEELLNSVDEKYRTILVLYYAEGFNTREIAELLELNEHTVKSRLARGRQKLAGQIAGEKKGERRYAL